MNFGVQMGVGAIFELVVRKADTHEIVRRTPRFKNIVLDSGIARMFVGSYLTRCCVGTGSSTPVATQTQLDNFLASTTAGHGGIDYGRNIKTLPYYAWARFTYRFAAGTINNNISEVGLGWANNALWNRALIKDAQGQPTTITVMADEYLDVICEVRNYLTADFSGSFNLLDKHGAVVSTHSYVGKPFIDLYQFYLSNYIKIGSLYLSAQDMVNSFDWGSFNEDLGSVSGMVSSRNETSMQIKYTVPLDRANGNHRTLAVKVSVLGSADPNSYTKPPMGFKIQINPPIPKNNTQEITYTFSVNVSRYEE